MISALNSLKSFIKKNNLSTERVDYLIRLAQKEGIYKTESGLVLDYDPSSPATITVSWAPESSKWKRGDKFEQGSDDFSVLFSMLKDE